LISRVESSSPEDEDGSPLDKTKTREYVEYTTAQVVKPSADVVKSTYLSHFMSSTDVHRSFCGRCGTSLTYYYSGPRPGWTLERNFDVAVGTLDKASLEIEGLRPDRHGWWSDGINWVKTLLRDGDETGGTRLVRHKTGSTKDCMNENEI
jgi:hypothetical protein